MRGNNIKSKRIFTRSDDKIRAANWRLPASFVRSRLPLVGLASCLMIASAPAQDAAPTPPGPNDVNPTLVTIHQKRATIKDVLDDLEKQSGAKFMLQFSPDTKVSVDADRQPFWKVMTDACDQANVGIMDGDWGNDQMMLQTTQPDPAHRVISGPVILHLNSISRVEQMTAPEGQQDFCGLQTWVRWEPRLAVAFVESYSTPTTAVDENGLSLVGSGDTVDPTNPNASRFTVPTQYQRRSTAEMHTIRLKIPANAGRHVAHLAGQVKLWVVTKTESVDITDVNAAQKNHPTLRAGDQQLIVQNIWSGPTNLQLQFVVKKRGDETDAAWQLRQAMIQSVKGHVEDNDGKPWSTQGFNQNGGAMQGVESYFYMNFQRTEGLNTTPRKLTLDVPSTMTEIDVPYDLKDLPLP